MFKTEQLEYNIILQSDNFYRYPQNIYRYTYCYNKEDLKNFYLNNMCLPVEIINMPYRGAIILFAMPSPIEVKITVRIKINRQ